MRTEKEVELSGEELDGIASLLVLLTKWLDRNGHVATRGCLGGEFGYGTEYGSELFAMHPFCWCDKDECPWCREEDPEPNFCHKESGLKIWWYKYIGRSMKGSIKRGHVPEKALCQCLLEIIGDGC